MKKHITSTAIPTHALKSVSLAHDMTGLCSARSVLRIPTQSGRGFRFEAGHHSDLIPATIPI
jgi:hypothetical protein